MAFQKIKALVGNYRYLGSRAPAVPTIPTNDQGTPLIPSSVSLPDTGYFNLEGGVDPATDRNIHGRNGSVTPVRFVSEPIDPNNLSVAFIKIVIVATSSLDPDEFPGGAVLANGLRFQLEVQVPGVGLVTADLDGKLPIVDLKDLIATFPGIVEIPITGATNMIDLSCPVRELFGAPFLLDVETATERRLVITINDDLTAAPFTTNLTSFRIATSSWTTPKAT